MSLLHNNCISGELFQWNKFGGITEMSSLGPNFKLGLIYDDACDEGFTVISQRTGKMVVFRLEDTKYDHEGDVTKWVFISVSPKVNLNIHIYND